MSVYFKFPPPPDLTRYIRGFHIADQQVGELTIQSPPTGYPLLGHIWKGIGSVCVRDIVVPQLAPPVTHFSGQLYRTNASVHWNGYIGHILAEFTATGLYELFGILGDELINKTVRVSALAPEFARKLDAELAEVESTESYLRCFEIALKEQALRASYAPRFVSEAVSIIEEARGDVKLRELTKRIGTAERTFLSRFKKVVGVPPKYFCRVTQFNYFVSVVLSGEKLPLSQLATEAGFYDQAHFTRAVQEFVLSAPSHFLEGDVTQISSFIRQMNEAANT
ncbi:Helix-turn-helix domain protein [Pseudovibrio sp. Ad46]|uniref:helix-turn-helix domain-containing protein n=1 Tax=Pseudovibrio sp. Ad46 TaxID=989432 RepID=UPI0007AEDC2A|nr:helix-turn-helix domain-containing protein [Pseudovibrio sp. Ad46]KZK93612.1 Helix-turn-helix domain protein [Pseudovibrio sp. Ad46]